MAKEKKPKSKALVASRKPRTPRQRAMDEAHLTTTLINDRKFFDAYIGEAKFSAWRAYMVAHPNVTPASARAHAPAVMRRVQPLLDQWLEDAGLSDNALKLKLIELLHAKEKRFFPYLKGGKQVITEVEVEALSIQAKMIELCMKAKGMLSEKSSREINQIDELIALELAKLAMAGQGAGLGSTAEDDCGDVIDVEA